MKSEFKVSSRIRCDVLIIGAGGAGLRCAAALLEKKPGTKIVAVTKVAHCEKSHTSTAQGGLSAVDPADNFDDPIYHMFDTWKGSDCSADQNVVKKIVEAGWEQVIWLENCGMHFTRNENGELSKRTFGGHTVRFGEGPAFRAVFEADRSGKGMLDTAWGVALRGNCSFMNQSIVTELLFKEGRCIGAILFNQKSAEFVSVLAQATVFATGGSGQVFKVTTNCRQNTGDALAVILKTELPVMDLEAVQFHPTGIVGPGILASETLRTVGGILRNKDMEPFMEHYAPKMKDLAPRDLVSRAIETEIREGRGVLNPDHNIEHVWLDLRHLPDSVHDEQIPEVSSFFKKFINIDPKKDPCPVRPSVHYHMGGIPTDEFGQVRKDEKGLVPGLFAVGECASASFHGFNRLGSNSLLELVTMGKFTGEKILDSLDGLQSELPKGAGEKTFSQFSSFFSQTGDGNLGQIRSEMQSLMTQKVGVFRREKDIMDAIETLKELKHRADKIKISTQSLKMNQELLQRWELDNLLSISMVIANGALHRRESRGGHAREDFPERNDEFNYHTMAYMEEYGQVKLGKLPLDMTLFESKCDHHEQFGMIKRKY
jgi:succinate dehydrogenase / fumarate reductase flavoprotein subunit